MLFTKTRGPFGMVELLRDDSPSCVPGVQEAHPLAKTRCVLLFPLFDGIFHLSADDQNIIINDGSPLLGQEIQTFIGTLISNHNRQAQISVVEF